MNNAVGLFVLIIPALLVRALVSTLSRGGRQSYSDRVVSLVAQLPSTQRPDAMPVLRSGATAIWGRRTGMVLGSAAAGLTAAIFGRHAWEAVVPAFGCGYLLGIACGEHYMARPMAGGARTSALDVRTVEDYLSTRLRFAVHGVNALAGATLVVSGLTPAADGGSFTESCTQATGSVSQTVVMSASGWPGSRDTAVLVTLFVALSLTAEAVLRAITRRPRPDGHPTLIYLDDTLRRASAQRVAAAALGCGLLTLALVYSEMSADLSSVCPARHLLLGGLCTGLAAGCALASLTAVIAVSSSRRQFEPVRTLPCGEAV